MLWRINVSCLCSAVPLADVYQRGKEYVQYVICCVGVSWAMKGAKIR